MQGRLLNWWLSARHRTMSITQVYTQTETVLTILGMKLIAEEGFNCIMVMYHPQGRMDLRSDHYLPEGMLNGSQACMSSSVFAALYITSVGSFM